MGATGTIIIQVPADGHRVVVHVPGQADIGADSRVSAWLDPSRAKREHQDVLCDLSCDVRCKHVVPGDGFDVVLVLRHNGSALKHLRDVDIAISWTWV